MEDGGQRAGEKVILATVSLENKGGFLRHPFPGNGSGSFGNDLKKTFVIRVVDQGQARADGGQDIDRSGKEPG